MNMNFDGQQKHNIFDKKKKKGCYQDKAIKTNTTDYAKSSQERKYKFLYLV